MFLNIANASLLIAQPFCGIVPAELLDEGHGVPGYVPWELNRIYAFQYDVVRLHRIGTGEGRRACQQLEHEDAQGPVIGADVVALVQDHLGRHVFGRAAKGPRLPAAR